MNLLIQLGKFRAFFALILTTVIFSTSGSTSARATGSDNWHWRNPLPTGNSLNSVAFGNGLFVAVGPDGNLQTSTDGLTWNAPLPPTTNTLSQVIYANSLYVSVGYNGVVLTSPDGVSWTNRISGTTNNLLVVAYGNSIFVAAGAAGTVLTSTDGVTWTAQNPGVVNDFGWIAFGSGKFIISTPQSSSTLSTLWPSTFPTPTTLISTDGASWTTNTCLCHRTVTAQKFINLFMPTDFLPVM